MESAASVALDIASAAQGVPRDQLAPIKIPIGATATVVAVLDKKAPPTTDEALGLARQRSKANGWPILALKRILTNGGELTIEISWPPGSADPKPGETPDPIMLFEACKQYGYISVSVSGEERPLRTDERSALDPFVAALYHIAETQQGVRFVGTAQ